MPTYEIHFKDKNGVVFETEEFESTDDAQAAVQAHVLYEKSIRHGFVLMRDTLVILSSPGDSNNESPSVQPSA